MLLRNPENLIVAALVGILGHLSKLAVKSGLAWTAIVFGAIGGILDIPTLKALHRAENR